MTKKEKRAYKKLIRHYKKKFRVLNREVVSHPFDYGPILDYFVEAIKYFDDYYTQDNNVWSIDEGRKATIKESLKEYELWKNCEDKYVDVSNFRMTQQSDGSYKEEGTVYLLGDPKKTWIACHKEEEVHWKKFWSIIAENLLRWWD